MAANAVTGTKIQDGAITTAKIAANAITAGKIDSNAITSDKIKAGAITSDKIKAGAITANEIAIGAVGSDQLAGGAVTAAELAANAVTTVKIKDGAITAAKITAGSITTDKLAANAITAEMIEALNCDFVQGTIGGFTISNQNLTNNKAGSSTGASIHITNADGTRFVYLNGGTEGSAAQFRNDNGNAVVITAYGSSTNYGLKILGNQDSKALHVTGSSYFITRKSNVEHTYISGLKVCTRSGSSFTASSDSTDPYFPSGTNVDFLIVTNNVTIPDASHSRGRVIYVKRRGSGKITIVNVYLSDGTFKSSHEWTDNYSRMLISDGIYWNEFYCK